MLMSTYHILGLRVGNRKIPTLTSQSTGLSSTHSMMHLLNGCNPFTVSLPYLSRCWTYGVVAKEEISWRKGHANLSKRATPTTDDNTAIVTRQAEVTPPPPAPPLLQPPGPMLPQTRSKSSNGPTLQPRQTVPDVPLQHPPSSSPQQELSPSPACSAMPLSPRGDPSIEPTSTSGRAPPPAGTFTFAGTSPFITTAAIDYLQTIPAGQRWADMIVSYLRLEEAPVSKGVSIPLSLRFYLY